MQQLPAMIFRNKEGKMLFQFRDSNAPLEPLVWSFFGGTSEPGEKALDTIIREMKEELGLTIAAKDVHLVVETLWTSPLTNTEKTVFLYEYMQPVTWQDLDVMEGAGAAFLTKKEISQLDNISVLVQAFLEKCN